MDFVPVLIVSVTYFLLFFSIELLIKHVRSCKAKHALALKDARYLARKDAAAGEVDLFNLQVQDALTVAYLQEYVQAVLDGDLPSNHVEWMLRHHAER